MIIRAAEKQDLMPLLELYTHLHGNPVPVLDQALESLWARILSDPNHHILLGLVDGRAVSSCVLIIVPNLTHHQHPYALIENVVTHEAYRGRGYATQLLNQARSVAQLQNCYKIMLMTGSKDQKILDFYERAGYNKQDKTAFIQWL